LAVIAGIDEAGYGPLLGPLVVSATAFELPDELASVSMWRLLAGAVSRRPRRGRSGVVIDDSKKLYSRQRAAGLKHLERAVLAAGAASGRRVDSLAALLAAAAPTTPEKLSQYPWYKSLNLPLPHSITPTDLTLSANAFSSSLAQASMRITALRSEVLFAGEFNRHVRATNNKSTMLFDVTGRLIAFLWRKTPGSLRIFVDRHGGRMRYLSALQRLFPGRRFKVLDETSTFSAYRVADERRSMEISFSVSADAGHLPVALASMLSKYLRELFMVMLNRFWAGLIPDIVPTAGYYVDGRRFFREVQPELRRLGLQEHWLRRCR